MVGVVDSPVKVRFPDWQLAGAHCVKMVRGRGRKTYRTYVLLRDGTKHHRHLWLCSVQGTVGIPLCRRRASRLECTMASVLESQVTVLEYVRSLDGNQIGLETSRS